MSSLNVCRTTEVVGEVLRRYTLQTLVDEKGGLIVRPLLYSEPVQLAEERGDVVTYPSTNRPIVWRPGIELTTIEW